MFHHGWATDLKSDCKKNVGRNQLEAGRYRKCVGCLLTNKKVEWTNEPTRLEAWTIIRKGKSRYAFWCWGLATRAAPTNDEEKEMKRTLPCLAHFPTLLISDALIYLIWFDLFFIFFSPFLLAFSNCSLLLFHKPSTVVVYHLYFNIFHWIFFGHPSPQPPTILCVIGLFSNENRLRSSCVFCWSLSVAWDCLYGDDDTIYCLHLSGRDWRQNSHSIAVAVAVAVVSVRDKQMRVFVP